MNTQSQNPDQTQDLILALLQEGMTEITERHPHYSLRRISLRLGITAPALSEILSRKRKVSFKVAERLFSAMAISPEKSGPLLELLGTGKPSIKKSKHLTAIPYHPLAVDEFKVISDWWYFAIMSLAETPACSSDEVELSKRLNITPKQVSTALTILRKLKLIYIRAGRLKRTGKSFATQNDVSDVAIRKNHRQGLELAVDALERVPILEREFGSMTLAIDPRYIPQAKFRIREFRKEMAQLLEVKNQSDVYRLQIQFFPVTQFQNQKTKNRGEKP